MEETGLGATTSLVAESYHKETTSDSGSTWVITGKTGVGHSPGKDHCVLALVFTLP